MEILSKFVLQIPKTKLRNIVPAPIPTSSAITNQGAMSTIQQNNTFLTQLLTQGTLYVV